MALKMLPTSNFPGLALAAACDLKMLPEAVPANSVGFETLLRVLLKLSCIIKTVGCAADIALSLSGLARTDALQDRVDILFALLSLEAKVRSELMLFADFCEFALDPKIERMAVSLDGSWQTSLKQRIADLVKKHNLSFRPLLTIPMETVVTPLWRDIPDAKTLHLLGHPAAAAAAAFSAPRRHTHRVCLPRDVLIHHMKLEAEATAKPRRARRVRDEPPEAQHDLGGANSMVDAAPDPAVGGGEAWSDPEEDGDWDL